MGTTRLRVTMSEVQPVVVRVLDVPAGVLLPELHDLLQAALGWTDSHLHQFVADGICYGMPDTDELEDERDESAVPLRALPSRFGYLYDFGDGWEHEVVVLGPGGEQPGCLLGEGACPPEDVGGPHGYAQFREALADPDDPEHDQMRRWAGDWTDEFDLAETDLLVRQTAGAVPAPVRLVLSLAEHGVRLTPGGRLPRAFVRQVQERYPAWGFDDRQAATEDDLPPLSTLHDLLRKVGLLRLRNRVLGPTRAADDDVQVIRRLRSWFKPDGGFVSILASETLASLVSAGPALPEELAARVFPLLGDRWVTGEGEPLNERDTCSQLYRLEAVLLGLDLIEADRGLWSAWSAGPSALTLLPHATGLAHLWSRSKTVER
ncbi:MAG: plasmid pRiA4b ORF-3 family protein [Acidimicrobiales bacterium]|nr:plasmid pRiA4b ORF-3 family protein [Acidimicrobiales bacterium]